ncbi:class I SAM-dependent methyltransferase [Sphingobacterium sp. CZ-2]|uniref:class I SAM-dependent methyltransferase n=1 Tax=Sphingobacterium sp. CZ-2 TaxID=2557994 RepID=UPI0010703949|nr:class I SAM-dependent methyltransferase [Sphingobacterium sp. CZ-2]QBR13189.1 SAM-dependent methyltransferase [Sphingobacterium sp. CZ-2]
MATFNDNFSKQASIYAQYRPSYPHELYDYLSELTPTHELAWDCGTGNGQSAIHLADFYDSVYASDPSEAQITNAFAHDRVTYKVEKAEESTLKDQSVDLVAIAQAIHWFDYDKFYAEVKRVLKKGGIIATWAYGIPSINKELDVLIKHFHQKTVGPYWPIETRSIDQEYTTIPFPFREIEPPEFYIRKRFKMEDLLGHLLSWSATQRFIEQVGHNPIDQLRLEVEKIWGNPQLVKDAVWKIYLRVGKIPA